MVWNKKFDTYLVETLDFKRSNADPCIYILKKSDQFVLLGLHVDDTLMVHNDDSLCNQVVNGLRAKFEITDLGEPTRLLGMRVACNSATGAIALSQESYIRELLQRFNIEDCKPSQLPHQPGMFLTESMSPSTQEEKEAMSNTPYGELIGALLWLSINTRPDILPAVGVLCRFVKNPGQRHWSAAKLVLRYLRGTLQFGILYESDQKNDQLIGYVDSDWASDPETRRSVTGYVLRFAKAAIAVKSKRQTSVSTSSVQAEYQALCDAARETVWLRELLRELGHEQVSATVLYEDN
jgi:hypothetical protein